MKTDMTCVEEGCKRDGLVGLFGRWLCLPHFNVAFEALKAAGDPRVVRQTTLSL